MRKKWENFKKIFYTYFRLPIKYAFISYIVIIFSTLLNFQTKIIVGFVLIVFIVYLTQLIFISQGDKSGEDRLLSTIVNFAIFTLMAAPVAVYAILLFVTSLPDFFPRAGSSDAWIGFSGSIIGGLMTIFALIFSITFSNKETKMRRVMEIKPNIVSSIVKYDNSELAIVGGDFLGYYITIVFKCISTYPASRFKIINSECAFHNKKHNLILAQNEIIDEKNSKFLLTVNDDFQFRCYIIIDPNDEITDSTFNEAIYMKLRVEVEFSDLDNQRKYHQMHSAVFRVYEKSSITDLLECIGDINIDEN